MIQRNDELQDLTT